MEAKTDIRIYKVFKESAKFITLFENKMYMPEMNPYRKRTKLELELANAKKLNKDLAFHLKEATRYCNEVKIRTEELQSRNAKIEADIKSLKKAEAEYELGEKLHGMQFDFPARKRVARGYYGNVMYGIVEPFEVDMSNANGSDSLWELIQFTAAPEWSLIFSKDNAIN